MNAKRINQLKTKLIFFSVLCISSPFSSFADQGCVISPLNTTISQGESIALSLKIQPPEAKARDFELRLGSLPEGVVGGFVATPPSVETQLPEFKLILNSTPSAQTGSFNIFVSYTSYNGTTFTEKTCPFNVVVKKATTSTVSSSEFSSFQNPIAYINGYLTLLPSIFTQNHSKKEETRKLESGSAVKKNVVQATSSRDFLFSKTLRHGMKGEDIKVLQVRLQKLGFFPQEMEITGYFGKVTRQSVEQFQKKNNLEPVGYTGPKTRKLLNDVNQ